MAEARSHFTALPTLAELKKIMQQESKRAVAKGKESIHYPNFSIASNLLQTLNIPELYFSPTITWEEFEQRNLFNMVNLLGEQVINAILANPQYASLYNKVYEYLATEDPLEKSDIIFVFGAKTPARIEKAIELYKQRVAPRLFLSGGNPFYHQTTISEAEKYQEIAVAKGVNPQDIMIEKSSITIPDNIRTSLNLLDQLKVKVQSITLVNSPYAQRRGWCVFKKYTPDSISIRRVNCTTSTNFAQEHWYKNVEGIQVIFNELVKLKLAVILNTA